MKKWMAIPALAGAVVLGGVGIAAQAANAENPVVTNTNLLPIEEVKAKAIEAVGGIVTAIDLDREVSGNVYEVEVKSKGFEYDLDIDAKTGKVLRTEKDVNDNDDQDDQDDSDDNLVVIDGKFIAQKAAVEIALKQAKGTVTEVELDDENGRVQYEIEIQNGAVEYDIDIDAISGKVLKVEKDVNNDNDNDND